MIMEYRMGDIVRCPYGSGAQGRVFEVLEHDRVYVQILTIKKTFGARSSSDWHKDDDCVIWASPELVS